MIKKYDLVKCHERSGSFGVKCYFEIAGTAKDIKFLALTLMSAKKLILKGKFEAVKNFSKIWYFRSGSVANISGSLVLYSSRGLDKSITEMYKNGLTKLAGSEGGFQYSFSGRVSN